TRPIRADEEARPHAAIRQFDAGLAATCPAEGRAVAQLSACLAGLAREPCHEARGIRSQEVVARRRQIDEGKRRTIEPYAPDAARESWRRLPALGYLLDQEPGGANAVACCPPPLEHDRAQPAQRSGAGAHEAREAAADDRKVISAGHGRPLLSRIPDWRKGTAERKRHRGAVKAGSRDQNPAAL